MSQWGYSIGKLLGSQITLAYFSKRHEIDLLVNSSFQGRHPSKGNFGEIISIQPKIPETKQNLYILIKISAKKEDNSRDKNDESDD